MEIAYGYQVQSKNDQYIEMMEKMNEMIEALNRTTTLTIFPWGEFDSCLHRLGIDVVQRDIYPLGSLARLGSFDTPEVSKILLYTATSTKHGDITSPLSRHTEHSGCATERAIRCFNAQHGRALPYMFHCKLTESMYTRTMVLQDPLLLRGTSSSSTQKDRRIQRQ